MRNAKDRPGGIDELKNQSEKYEGPAEGLDELKNRSGKCERPAWGGGGARRVKEPEWEMRRTEARGGDQRLFEKKSFF